MGKVFPLEPLHVREARLRVQAREQRRAADDARRKAELKAQAAPVVLPFIECRAFDPVEYEAARAKREARRRAARAAARGAASRQTPPHGGVFGTLDDGRPWSVLFPTNAEAERFLKILGPPPATVNDRGNGTPDFHRKGTRL